MGRGTYTWHAYKVKKRDKLRRRITAGLRAVSDAAQHTIEVLHGLWQPSLGRRGETIAARYLKRRGYRVLARNFRAAGAEIDLVAMEGETLVFVEVKTRLGTGAGMPQEAVDGRKQRRIRRAAEIYAARHRASQWPMRFDVVAILGTGSDRRLELLRDAF